MSTRRRRYLRRTDLFLVRVWTEETSALVDVEESGDVSSSRSESSDEAGREEWYGSVQRVVDGEAHQFKGWQSLADTLRAMLPDTRGKFDQ